MTQATTRLLTRAVRRWAERMPTATAVLAPDGAFSFAELLSHARRIAGALATAGARPGVSVGISLDRSRYSLPGLLAVWSLGATAVPLAARDPVDRTSFILGDSGVRVLLAARPPAGALPRGVSLVRPDAPSEPHEAPVAPPPGACAYVIYTSGTTGWPKGVEISYRGLGTFVTALDDLALPVGGLGINAVSPAFDGWLWCTLLYLTHGQGMALLDPVNATMPSGVSADDDGDLGEQISAVKPRTVCLTPSLLASCVESVTTAEVIVAAGEPLPPALVHQLAPDRRMLNVYGPTETTIAATWADSDRGDDLRSIGRALPGYTTYVLDDALRPVAPGEVGELHIGGDAVALGYRNRPGLTGERFLPDPWAKPGGRMYRTGDLVSMRSDGTIDFQGRDDAQVKVRGFRIELTEVEHAAAAAGDVRAAAAFVLAAGDSIGLAVVLAPGSDPTQGVAAIRAHCVAKLADHMVPAVITAIETIPTTSTGKVDRQKLATRVRAESTRGGRPPTTEREKLICETWGSLLQRPVTDVDADFFELGGHSLLAARAVSELRRRTGLRLSVRHLLANPTPATLAAAVDALASPAGATGAAVSS